EKSEKRSCFRLRWRRTPGIISPNLHMAPTNQVKSRGINPDIVPKEKLRGIYC
ncbi:hypothetical protein MKX03_026437, partial [Papaver bracteatum]